MPADLLAWARMPKGGQNAKIPPSLKSVVVLKKKKKKFSIKLALAIAIAIAIAIALIRVPAIAAVRKIGCAE